MSEQTSSVVLLDGLHGPPSPRNRRATRWRWVAGVVVAIVFHAGLILMLNVGVRSRQRLDRPDSRVEWVGDRSLLEEGTLRGQMIAILDDAPLFLPTPLNYASRRQSLEDLGPPGEIFPMYDSKLTVPLNESPPGLLSGQVAVENPIAAVRSFEWPYWEAFGRNDPAPVALPRRLAAIDVQALDTGERVRYVSIPATAQSANWPDWQGFELYVTISETGRLSEPVVVGRGSGADVVDTFIRDYIRTELRLDLYAGPGSYRLSVGP